MLKFFKYFILVFFFFSNSYATKVFVDQENRTIELTKTPERIVSFAPSITEIVFALKKGDLLKGVTVFSNYPKEASKIERIGSYINLNIEKILMLKPDLCIAVKDGNPKKQVMALEKLGIKIYVSSSFSVSSIKNTIYELGNILDAKKRAKELVDTIDKKIDEISSKVTKVKVKPKVFFQLGTKPMVSVGKNTYINELIEIAGGDNIAKNLSGYPVLSTEKVIEANPDIIIILTMSTSSNNNTTFWNNFDTIKAVKNRNIVFIDSDVFVKPSVRIVEALECLNDIIMKQAKK